MYIIMKESGKWVYLTENNETTKDMNKALLFRSMDALEARWNSVKETLRAKYEAPMAITVFFERVKMLA